MNYCILRAAHPELLAHQVNEAIKDGWVPQGGVLAVQTPGGMQWAQAISFLDIPDPKPTV